MTFNDALDQVMKGGAIRRGGWPEHTFVFAQVPAEIGKDIVPKMQSLPDGVKEIFEARFNDPGFQISAIYYSGQMAIVDKSNSIKGYNPSADDVLALDWKFYKH